MNIATATRLTALFEVLICSDFPTQLFVAQVLSLAGLHPFTPTGTYSAAFIFTLSLADTALLVALILIFLRLHGESPRAVLLGRRPPLAECLLGALLVPVVLVLAGVLLMMVYALVPSLHNVASNPLETLIGSRRDAVLFAVVAVVTGGVREEVQRGFILHRFDEHLGGGVVGLMLFSIVFGAGHVIQGWDAAIATAVLGAFWGALYLMRRSIVAPLVSHAGFDLAEIIRYTLYVR